MSDPRFSVTIAAFGHVRTAPFTAPTEEEAIALASARAGLRVTVKPMTCACGQWPLHEYGERCPSCPEPVQS